MSPIFIEIYDSAEETAQEDQQDSINIIYQWYVSYFESCINAIP
jgi:hypothetical protein